MKNIRIGNKLVGEGQRCFIIAEAGVNHNGDVDLAKKLIDVAKDAGADAVIGFGPHVMRGLEWYKGRLIAYSLGNFLPAGRLSVSGELSNSCILKLRFSSDGKTLLGGKIVPVTFIGKLPVIDPNKSSIKFIQVLTKQLYLDNRGGKQDIFISDDGELLLPTL